MNIDTMTMIELKALGFDLVLELQRVQNNIQIVNQQIAEKSKPEEVTPEVLPETPASE